MSVSGLCQVCESATAQYRCDRCGSLVCAAHYDRELGLCTECASETRSGRGGGRDRGDGDGGSYGGPR